MKNARKTYANQTGTIGHGYTLMSEASAKAKAADLQKTDDSWTYSANLINVDKNLWEVRFTDEDGYSERMAF